MKSDNHKSLIHWITLIWFSIDAFTHLSIELGYVCLALTSTAEKSDTFLGFIWREYGRADKRWAVRDPGVISIEIMTVCVGFLCIFQLIGVYLQKPWRHVLQVIICVCELYGGWMTFAPEWIENNPNLDGSNFILLWIYLVFMNGLWVLVPIILLWDSAAIITEVCQSNTKSSSKVSKYRPHISWYYLVAGTLILYMILVPAVLFSAEGVPVKK